MFGAGFQHREDAADALADPGRRLRQQRAAARAGLVHGFRKLALAGAEVGMREAQGAQLLVARGAVRQFLLGPGHEAAALLFEENAQGSGIGFLGEHRFLLRADVEVDQGQAQGSQFACGAQQMAVDLELGPVQDAVVGGLARQVAAVGLDFFELVLARVVAVGASAHMQRAEITGQADFALIFFATAAGDDGVAFNAFLRGGRGREAQVQVALLGGELAQGTDGNRVAHSCHAR